MRARKAAPEGITRVALTLQEAEQMCPWGRSKFQEDVANGTCPTFRIGRRKFITESMMHAYVETLVDRSAKEDPPAARCRVRQARESIQ